MNSKFPPYWTSKRLWLASFLVFSLALVVRFYALYEGQNTPLMYAHQWNQSDMDFFDRWALGISQGDWLNKKGPHPYHIWHNQLTKLYFESHPQDTVHFLNEAQRLSQMDTGMSMGKALIYHWYGGPTYHQEPLYVYLVALTYKVFGHNVLYVYIWQSILGALTTTVLFLFSLFFFGTLAGVVATLLALLCGPLIFFDMVLLRTSLTVFFTIALLS
jgi:hypothetical protein